MKGTDHRQHSNSSGSQPPASQSAPILLATMYSQTPSLSYAISPICISCDHMLIQMQDNLENGTAVRDFSTTKAWSACIFPGIQLPLSRRLTCSKPWNTCMVTLPCPARAAFSPAGIRDQRPAASETRLELCPGPNSTEVTRRHGRKLSALLLVSEILGDLRDRSAEHLRIPCLFAWPI